MKTISIMATWHDGSDSGGCELRFLTDRTDLLNDNVILSDIRQAVRNYLDTEDGKEANERACNDFNWGDVLTEVPDEVFKAIGLTPIEPPMADIVINVEHDEVFCSE